MSYGFRRSSLLLLWLLLALLPLRGWAHLSMHLPAADAGIVAPCHGEQSEPEASGTTPSCTLCGICHGAMLPWADAAAPQPDPRSQELPAAAPRAAPAGEPDALFRPPRR